MLDSFFFLLDFIGFLGTFGFESPPFPWPGLLDCFPCVSQCLPPALRLPDDKGMDRLIGNMIFENEWLQKEPLAKQAALMYNLLRKAVGHEFRCALSKILANLKK